MNANKGVSIGQQHEKVQVTPIEVQLTPIQLQVEEDVQFEHI